MNVKIQEILTKQSQKNQNDIEMKLFPIFKPSVCEVNEPFIYVDDNTYYYTFDNRRFFFDNKNDELFFVPDEIRKLFILKSQSSEPEFITLSSKNKVECNIFDKKTLSCKYTINRNVIDMVKTEKNIYYVFTKGDSFFINELYYDGKRYIGKHLYTDTISESENCNIKTCLSEDHIFIIKNRILYNESGSLNIDADFIHVYGSMIFGCYFCNDDTQSNTKRCQLRLYEIKSKKVIFEMYLDIEKESKFYGYKNIIIIYNSYKIYACNIAGNLIKCIDSRKQRHSILSLGCKVSKNTLIIYILVDRSSSLPDNELPGNNLTQHIESAKAYLSMKLKNNGEAVTSEVKRETETFSNNNNDMDSLIVESINKHGYKKEAFTMGSKIGLNRHKEAFKNENDENDIKENNVKENDIKENNVKENDVKDNNVKDNNVKDNNVKENNVKDNNVKDNNVKDNNVKDNNVKENNVKGKENASCNEDSDDIINDNEFNNIITKKELKKIICESSENIFSKYQKNNKIIAEKDVDNKELRKQPCLVGNHTFSFENNMENLKIHENYINQKSDSNFNNMVESLIKLQSDGGGIDLFTKIITNAIENVLVKNHKFIDNIVIKGILPVIETGFNEIRIQLMSEIKNLIYLGKEEINNFEKNEKIKRFLSEGNVNKVFIELKKYDKDEFDSALQFINPKLINNIDSNILVDFIEKIYLFSKNQFIDIYSKFLIECLTDLEIKNLSVDKLQKISVNLRYLSDLDALKNNGYDELNSFIRFVMNKIKKRSYKNC